MTRPLRVAFVHYHVDRGGVTRVIEHAVNALSGHDAQCMVISGKPADHGVVYNSTVVTVDGIGYDSEGSCGGASDLVARLKAAVSESLGGPPDIWHVHNHSLGKNVLLPEVVCRMAEQGERLLLHIHDFAEDGRPENYLKLRKYNADKQNLAEVLYPQYENVHYALLNTRDRQFLEEAGFASERTHLLPNAVWMEGNDNVEESSDTEPGRLFLYPTRAIRRKNIGEFIYWASVAGHGDRYAVTMAPQNPREIPYYERWVDFAGNEQLPVEFEAGSRLDYSMLIRSSFSMVTTSIAEGFGLAFLEPWLAGRPLAGRNLSGITREFTEEGVDLTGLYERLYVPIDWVSMGTWKNKLNEALKAYFQAYGRSQGDDDLERAVSSSMKNGMVDFGRLDEELQEQVIRVGRKSLTALGETDPSSLVSEGADKEKVIHNMAVIQERFGLDQYGKRLMAIYGMILDSGTGRGTEVDAEAVLDKFLSPERFHLLRT